MSESLRSFLSTALTKKGTDARLDDFLAGSTSRRSNTEDDGRKAPGTSAYRRLSTLAQVRHSTVFGSDP